MAVYPTGIMLARAADQWGSELRFWVCRTKSWRWILGPWSSDCMDKCKNSIAKSSGGQIRTFEACHGPIIETPKPEIKLSQLG